MGAAIFLWIIFIGWLMWSSKADKEVFLFYAWASMIVIGASDGFMNPSSAQSHNGRHALVELTHP